MGTLVLALTLAGCGDSGGPSADGGLDSGGGDSGGADSGGGPDGSTMDGGGTDAGEDSGMGEDAGEDSGMAEDSGGADAGMCGEGLGAACSDVAPCGAAYECNLGRCMPQAREVCGGFAGAPCTMPPYTECLYFTSADFGTCLTPAEYACVCARPDADEHYACD
jgi:hypothetical protein